MDEATVCLREGGLVAYPTESFYGLAVDATNETAVRRLFQIKKRGPDRPVLILIPSLGTLASWVATVPAVARFLMERFWPGGLTLVFEAGQAVSPLLTAGTGRIGIRLSSHPVATALTQALGAPITGTSANISGEPACRSAAEVVRALGQSVTLLLDGGRTQGTAGSTILDVTADPPEVLREGMVTIGELQEVIGIHLENPSSVK
jgi:L-threonylcarbamoyladenylate synthase